MTALLPLLFFVAGGAIVARCALGAGQATTVAGLAPPLGLGLAAAGLFAARGAGTAGPAVWPAAAVLLLAAGGFVALRRRWPHEPEGPRPAPRREAAVAVALGVLSLVPLLAAAPAYRENVPTGAYDAVAIWNLRARQLFLAWKEAPAVLAASDAPLLLPGAIAAQAAGAGSLEPAIGWGTSLAFAVSVVILAGALAGRVGGVLAGGVAAFAVGTIPFFVGEGLSQEADVPVAAFLLGAWICLWRTVAPARAALGGVLLGLLAWTKLEGFVHVVVALAALAAGQRGPFAPRADRRRSLAALAGGLAAGAIPAIAQKLFFDRGARYGVGSFLAGPGAERWTELDRWTAPARALAGQLVAAPWEAVWGAAPLALLVLVVTAILRRRDVRIPGAGRAAAVAAAGTAGFWLVAFALTPYDVAWHLATALDRLILQGMPLALALAAGLALAPGVRGETASGPIR